MAHNSMSWIVPRAALRATAAAYHDAVSTANPVAYDTERICGFLEMKRSRAQPFQSRLSKPYTQESETSSLTMQSSRNVPSSTKPSFSRTRADATLRVSVSA